jgi:hypothetical protein
LGLDSVFDNWITADDGLDTFWPQLDRDHVIAVRR